jgi:hypothetical protein
MAKYVQTTAGITEVFQRPSTSTQTKRVLYLNALDTTYPVKTVGELVVYVGHIKPSELGIVMDNGDVWKQDVTRPAEIVDWLPNSQTFASVSSGKATNTRYRIMSVGGVATEYRDVNINLASKEGIQFFGETGVNGVNLITLNGSTLLTSWSLVGGYYECAASSIINQNVIAGMESSAAYDSSRNTSAYSFNQIETLYKDDVPLIGKSSKVNVLANNEFYFDGVKVYVLFNPTANKMEFTKYDTFVHCGLYAGGATTSSDCASNVVISNLNITKYGGNIFGSVVGNRNFSYSSGKAYASGTPMFGWVLQYINSYNNRGAGLFFMTKGTIRYCKSYQNGANGVISSIGAATDTSLSGSVYGYIYGNTVFENNFSGYTNAGASGVAGGLKLTECIGIKVYDNNIYRNGKSIFGDYPTDGLWFDVNVAFAEVKYNRIIGNVGVGFTYEICNDLVCEDNFIHSNTGSWQMVISTCPNIAIRRNKIYGILKGEQSQPASTTFSHRLIGFLHATSRSGSQPLLTSNVLFEDNDLYFGLENTNEGVFGSVVEYWFQGTFTPASPTLQQIADFMRITQNMIFRNNRYHTKTLDTTKLHFSYWTSSIGILRETLATWQGRGLDIGSTVDTITF